MNEELTWLDSRSMETLFRKYDEDRLREIIWWLDEQTPEVVARVKPALDRELNRRAAVAYESMNNGEWI